MAVILLKATCHLSAKCVQKCCEQLKCDRTCENSVDFLKMYKLLKVVNAHCCHMGTTIKHFVPDRVKPSFVIFDIRAL